MRLSLSELSLIQVIFYSLIFLSNQYAGFLICAVATVISAAILLVSLIVELVDRSKVPRYYYRFMLSAVICPLLVLIIFVSFYPDALSWMDTL